MHFDAVGSPVMIGGSNLAHTILGIDWDAAVGTVRFEDEETDRQTETERQCACVCGWVRLSVCESERGGESVYLSVCVHNCCFTLPIGVAFALHQQMARARPSFQGRR